MPGRTSPIRKARAPLSHGKRAAARRNRLNCPRTKGSAGPLPESRGHRETAIRNGGDESAWETQKKRGLRACSRRKRARPRAHRGSSRGAMSEALSGLVRQAGSGPRRAASARWPRCAVARRVRCVRDGVMLRDLPAAMAQQSGTVLCAVAVLHGEGGVPTTQRRWADAQLAETLADTRLSTARGCPPRCSTGSISRGVECQRAQRATRTAFSPGSVKKSSPVRETAKPAGALSPAGSGPSRTPTCPGTPTSVDTTEVASSTLRIVWFP